MTTISYCLITIAILLLIASIVLIKLHYKHREVYSIKNRCANCIYSQNTYIDNNLHKSFDILLYCKYKSKITSPDNICKKYLSKITKTN